MTHYFSSILSILIDMTHQLLSLLKVWMLSLYNYYPFPKNSKTPVLEDGVLADLEYADLNEAKAKFLEGFDAFELYYKENPEATANNAVFGPLDKDLWDLMNRKHFNHHFEQFSIL